MALESLKLLEEKLDGFLTRHEQMRKDREDLVARLQEQERAHALLSERLRHYEQERNEMRDRLENILSRFAEIDV
jgi:predicted nuclease with TOPRIM domain